MKLKRTWQPGHLGTGRVRRLVEGTEGVTTPAPISDADDRARLIEKRKNGLPCTLVCGDEGLSAGAVFTVRCVRPLGCIDAGLCFWRKFHKL